MQLKNGFILREIAGKYVVVATGEAAESFRGLIKLNDTGAFLWRLLQKDTTEEELTSSLLSEYDVDRPQAEREVASFISRLKEEDLLAGD